jgi:hypothetical protein
MKRHFDACVDTVPKKLKTTGSEFHDNDNMIVSKREVQEYMHRVETTKASMEEAITGLQTQVQCLQNEKMEMEHVFRHELKQKTHELDLMQMRFVLECNAKF